MPITGGKRHHGRNPDAKMTGDIPEYPESADSALSEQQSAESASHNDSQATCGTT
jgi:hypothetical protein